VFSSFLSLFAVKVVQQFNEIRINNKHLFSHTFTGVTKKRKNISRVIPAKAGI